MAALHNVRGLVLVCHLAGIVFWVGGLLVLARVLRFHADEPPSVRVVLTRLESWLQYLFALPGLVLVTGTGLWLVRERGFGWLRVSLWMHLKTGLVVALVLLHLALWSAQRRVAATDPQRAVIRGSWRLQVFCLWLLLVATLTLSVLQPFVGGR